MDYLESRARNRAVEKAEADGRVADSLEVRMTLIRRHETGEISFDEMQAELKRIKRNAKKNGQVTRADAWRGK
jgi:hypothetical protein